MGLTSLKSYFCKHVFFFGSAQNRPHARKALSFTTPDCAVQIKDGIALLTTLDVERAGKECVKIWAVFVFFLNHFHLNHFKKHVMLLSANVYHREKHSKLTSFSKFGIKSYFHLHFCLSTRMHQRVSRLCNLLSTGWNRGYFEEITESEAELCRVYTHRLLLIPNK